MQMNLQDITERSFTMNEYERLPDTFSLRQLALITGLTDRTLRTHLTTGILQGEMADGAWRFTPEQVEAYTQHPSVRPSILAKNNSIIFDFLKDNYHKEDTACIVLDLPDVSRNDVISFFSRQICRENLHDFRFSYDGVGSVCRVILRGPAQDVLRLASLYYQQQ